MSAATTVAPNHDYAVYPAPVVSTTAMHVSEQPLDASVLAWTNNQVAETPQVELPAQQADCEANETNEIACTAAILTPSPSLSCMFFKV